ncbi:MAG: tRNA lysidine(34) synthetase TilS [Cyclobacteriaceae bacterium]
MIKALLKFVDSEKLFSNLDHVLLAVSGGVDSMAMAHLFLDAGLTFSIAHVNYNLRGKDSVADRDFVVNWAKTNNINVHVREVEESEYSSGGSIQMIARNIRYAFFNDLVIEKGYIKVATAHHLNDSLETLLLNLTKGTGAQGIKGIPVKNGIIIRPMMFASQIEILDYVKSNSIEWREDVSNSKVKYQRNLIRHKVIPALKEVNPSLEETFKDTLTRLRGVSEVVLSSKNSIIENHLSEEKGLFILDTSWVEETNESLSILSEILSDYGLSFVTSKDVFANTLHGKSGSIFHSFSHSFNVDRGRIIIAEEEKKSEEVTVISEGMNRSNHSKSTLLFEKLDGDVQIDRSPNCAYLDYDTIKWPIKIRGWRKGDKFTPLGMKGEKMVSDFMIDNKIPVTLKRRVLILETGGQIAWLVGLRIGERFKITTKTKKTLKISVSDAEVF